MNELVAGIDIGGTNSQIGLVDKEGQILFSENFSTSSFSTPDELVNEISYKINQFLNDKKDKFIVKGIGIGAPNGNYYTGNIEFAPNLSWKGIVPLSEMFSKKMNIPALLTNDANAAALGEMIFGAAKNMKNFLFITLGTGLGSGIVVNGELVYGHDGFAGEIGHVIMVPNGRKCGCGRNGCLETYCSATAIINTFKEFSDITISKPIEAKYVYDRALMGDSAAIKTFEYTGNMLGLALANSVAYTSPEAIFLFGGLAQAGDFLFTPTQLSFEKNLLNIYKGKIKLLSSTLKENDAAVLGAASLIWSKYK